MKQLQTLRVQVSLGIRRPVYLWFRGFLDGFCRCLCLDLQRLLGEALLSREKLGDPWNCANSQQRFFQAPPSLHAEPRRSQTRKASSPCLDWHRVCKDTHLRTMVLKASLPRALRAQGIADEAACLGILHIEDLQTLKSSKKTLHAPNRTRRYSNDAL